MTKIIWAMVIVQSQGEKNRFTTNDMPVPARCRLLRVPERLQQQQIKVLPLKVEMVVLPVVPATLLSLQSSHRSGIPYIDYDNCNKTNSIKKNDEGR